MAPRNKKDRAIVHDEPVLPSYDHIERQLRKIISSPEFHATSQQRDFLKFVVAETLAGRSTNLKGYTVATQVFGRPVDFDISVDPIVSIQANKLRRALERYYLVDGRFDPIKIIIPKGTYIPKFVMQGIDQHCTAQDTEVAEHTPDNSWPTILIMPFKNLTGEPGQDFLGTGISTELAIEISRFENIRVFYPREGIPKIVSYPAHTLPRYVLNGDVYKETSGIKLALILVDTESGQQIWGDICRAKAGLAELCSFKEQLVQVVATKVCGERGIIPRAISKETKDKKPSELSSYEAMLRFWEYEQTQTPESFKRAFEALCHAEALEPDCCQILGSLAIVYGTMHSLDIPGVANPLEKAVQCAEKAAVINPNNQRVLGILAFARLFSNDLPAAVSEAHRAIDLNPNSLFVLDGLAWILTLAGDWEHGPPLAEKAIRLNPFHRAVAHDALWLNYLRQRQYDFAYKVSCNRPRSTLFWDPLIRASTSGLTGHYQKGLRFAEKLLELRPDFLQTGRKLIRNYIKFEEIAVCVEHGLQGVGVDLS